MKRLMLALLLLFPATVARADDTCESERAVMAALAARLSQSRGQVEIEWARAEARARDLAREVEALKAKLAEGKR